MFPIRRMNEKLARTNGFKLVNIKVELLEGDSNGEWVTVQFGPVFFSKRMKARPSGGSLSGGRRTPRGGRSDMVGLFPVKYLQSNRFVGTVRYPREITLNVNDESCRFIDE